MRSICRRRWWPAAARTFARGPSVRAWPRSRSTPCRTWASTSASATGRRRGRFSTALKAGTFSTRSGSAVRSAVSGTSPDRSSASVDRRQTTTCRPDRRCSPDNCRRTGTTSPVVHWRRTSRSRANRSRGSWPRACNDGMTCTWSPSARRWSWRRSRPERICSDVRLTCRAKGWPPTEARRLPGGSPPSRLRRFGGQPPPTSRSGGWWTARGSNSWPPRCERRSPQGASHWCVSTSATQGPLMCPSRIPAPIRIVLHHCAGPMGTTTGTSAQILRSGPGERNGEAEGGSNPPAVCRRQPFLRACCPGARPIGQERGHPKRGGGGLSWCVFDFAIRPSCGNGNSIQGRRRTRNRAPMPSVPPS